MKRAALGLVLLAACAGESTDGTGAPQTEEPPPAAGNAEPPAPPPGEDCEECRLFPKACTSGAFCPVPVHLKAQQSLRAISARSASDVWVAGSHGGVLRYDGATWSVEAMALPETFGAVLFRTPGETWLGSSLQSIYVGGTDGGAPGWTRLGGFPETSSPNAPIRRLWSSAGGAWVWAVLDDPSMARTLVRVRPDAERAALEVQNAPGIAAPRSVNGITGISKDELWAVGDLGFAYRITAADSSAPVGEPIDTRANESLQDIEVISSDDIWAVGTLGTVLHCRGPIRDWERIEVPTKATLRAIAVAAPNDVWLVGDAATIVHFDGARWSAVPVAGLEGTRPNLHALAVLPDGRVFVAGDHVLLELTARSGN